MTGKRPFRCHVCGWRGWFDETELRFLTSAQKPLPPQVAGSDVPIPDIRLDDTQGRMPWRTSESGNGGNGSGTDDAAPPRRRVSAAQREAARRGEAAAGEDVLESEECRLESEEGSPEDLLSLDDDRAFELSDLPPDFDEQTGHPVSDKVSTAFHHHARNKSKACPKCGEFVLYRSRTRTIGETLKKQFTRKRPYRCHRCGWRGWLTE